MLSHAIAEHLCSCDFLQVHTGLLYVCVCVCVRTLVYVRSGNGCNSLCDSESSKNKVN